MPVKMKPTSVIIAKLGLEPDGKALKFFTSECAKAMDKFVPMKDGNLADYDIQGNHIIYKMPYARYQYEGVSHSGKPLNYSKDKHPLATHHWDKAMWSVDGNDLVDSLQRMISRGG